MKKEQMAQVDRHIRTDANREGRSRYPGKRYEEEEANLERDHERARGTGGSSWDKARNATRDAWNRVEEAVPGDADGVGR